MKHIVRVKDFTRFPGPRYIKLGKHSGEEFRNTILIPAIKENSPVLVDLDGTIGYGSSFLDEAFAGLLRAGISDDVVLEIIGNLKTDDYPELLVEIKQYVNEELARKNID